MLYAHAIDDGEQRWRAELGVGPSQQPFASPMGILMGTVNGNAYKIGTERGEVVALAPSVRGSTFVFPFGDEAVVLGGGTGGYRVVDADGNVRTMGDARPRFDRTPSVTSDGVIWTDGDGAVRFLRRAGDAPVRVGALGTTVQGVTLHGNTLYATTTDGSLRAASLTNPDQLRFEVALGGRVESEPLTVGSALFVLVDGQLVAVEI